MLVTQKIIERCDLLSYEQGLEFFNANPARLYYGRTLEPALRETLPKLSLNERLKIFEWFWRSDNQRQSHLKYLNKEVYDIKKRHR